MAIKNDSYKLYEPRIKKILSQSKISKLEIVELFEIMHIYNAVPKLIPEELSKWCNNMGIELRDKSRSLDRTLGLTKDVRLTDNLAMSMVVSDIWAEIFNEENQKEAFQNIAIKYNVKIYFIKNSFLGHWENGLNYYLVLRMKSLSPFEIGLVCSNIKILRTTN